jgi:rare lipoprotein A (peptidoglycan hydrolase)
MSNKTLKNCILLLSVNALILQGCSYELATLTRKTGGEYSIKGKKYLPLKAVPLGSFGQGVASWYGPGFHGKKTASGEVYNMNALTAAHKTLPMGTIIHVINMDNNKEAILRINDRGPFSGTRILDVSKSAAKKLGMIRKGAVRVRYNVIGFCDPKKPKKDLTLVASNEKAAIQNNPFIK